MILRVGLTGGIGSGKSTVARLFAEQGASIIDADEIAKALTEKNTPAFETILQHFGPTVLTQEGSLDRRKLRSFIFENPIERSWLEQLLHPLIRHFMQQQIQKTQGAYCILVIPLLCESKSIDFVDRICVVDLPLKQQIERVMARDKLTLEEIQRIIASQCSREKRLAMADDVIQNNGTLATLKSQAQKLHRKYKDH